MNVRRVGLVLGVVIGFLGSAVRADDGVTLQYKLAKGDKLIYRAKLEMKQTQNIMGMAIENELNHEAVSSWTVEGIDEKGNYQLTLRGERLKVKAKFGQLGDYVFDSQSSERDKSSMLGGAVTPLFERLSGAVYQATVSPEGEVLEVKGYADLLKDVLQDNPLAAQFSGGGTDEAAKHNLQEQFPKFGKKPLKPGDSWVVPSEVALPGVGKTKSKTTYRLVGTDKVGNRTTAKIETSNENSVDLDIDSGGAKVTGTISTTSSTGVVQFDIAAGRVISHQGSATLGGDLNVNAGGMNIPVRNDQTMKVSVEYLDKLPD